MKKIKFTDKEKEKLVEEFKKSIDNYEDNMNNEELSFSKKFDEKPKEKIKVFFTPEAYMKCQMLVKEFTGEVGWNGLMIKQEDGSYLVYDMLVYPQIVNGARTLDPTETNDWYEKHLDELEFMNFQAHSHNTMGTTPSGTDMTNQKNIVKNLGGHGFRLFQIWNKAGDINSFLYDLDANILYDRNDIDIQIALENGTMSEFIADAKKNVSDMPKPVVYNPPKTYLPEKKYVESKDKKYGLLDPEPPKTTFDDFYPKRDYGTTYYWKEENYEFS